MQAIADVDLHLRSPDALVGELSGGQRQGVAIARAMHFKSKVLILDEPTNHLSVKETNKVLGFVRGLKEQNVTGIFISHNMHHVFQSCDRIVAMARGEIVFDKPVGETSVDEVQELLLSERHIERGLPNASLLTGALGTLGRAQAATLARAGAKLLLLDRPEHGERRELRRRGRTRQRGATAYVGQDLNDLAGSEAAVARARRWAWRDRHPDQQRRSDHQPAVRRILARPSTRTRSGSTHPPPSRLPAPSRRHEGEGATARSSTSARSR